MHTFTRFSIDGGHVSLVAGAFKSRHQVFTDTILTIPIDTTFVEINTVHAAVVQYVVILASTREAARNVLTDAIVAWVVQAFVFI